VVREYFSPGYGVRLKVKISYTTAPLIALRGFPALLEHSIWGKVTLASLNFSTPRGFRGKWGPNGGGCPLPKVPFFFFSGFFLLYYIISTIGALFSLFLVGNFQKPNFSYSPFLSHTNSFGRFRTSLGLLCIFFGPFRSHFLSCKSAEILFSQHNPFWGKPNPVVSVTQIQKGLPYYYGTGSNNPTFCFSLSWGLVKITSYFLSFGERENL